MTCVSVFLCVWEGGLCVGGCIGGGGRRVVNNNNNNNNNKI